jgi:hypothetical protein
VPFVISVILLTCREIIVGTRARRAAALMGKLDDAATPKSP